MLILQDNETDYTTQLAQLRVHNWGLISYRR